ncbi:hypothetical protein ABG768_020808 [Culter alburnus]|uniref:C-type lectin domain-containing protein n=1 Tax=Culter alburnus TaxID=194366 RepID=A0AAW2AQ88_CULAL
MIFLSLLLLLWGVPLSNASGRLRSFHLINEQQMSINEARKTCTSNYTDLVTIYNGEENSELVNFLKKSSLSTGWIGASSCKWSNRNPVAFTNISSNFTEENCCGAINTDGDWECFNCSSTKIYFMCYDQDYKQQSYNYSLIRENKTWFEAQLYCRKNHTDLVTIRNYEENERVKEARNGSNSFWIGLQYNTNVDWLDGGHSNYTQNNKSKGCFTFLSMHGFWVKSNGNGCSALCYKSFIYVSPVKKSWEDALIYCNRHYSGLLRIESESDQKEIQQELRRKDISGPVWVGLRQSRLFGFWMWSNGLHVGHWTNWKVGSQTEHLISQHCGATEEVDGEYKWSDKDCRSEFTFLCEVK